MKLFGCQFGGHGHSFCHAHIIHSLNGFDITPQYTKPLISDQVEHDTKASLPRQEWRCR
jgi:hypothetical protein